MNNFSFDYGNAHWTIVDSNPYMDWTDSTLVKLVKFVLKRILVGCKGSKSVRGRMYDAHSNQVFAFNNGSSSASVN